MKREYRSNPGVELRQELSEPLKIRGYAAVFNQLSEPLLNFRERIKPGAFAKSLRNDVRALVNHDPSQIIGRTKSGTLKIREDDHGLLVEIVPPNTTVGHDVIESLRRGDLDQMSFAFSVDEGGRNWNGKDESGMRIRELTDVNLMDVSVVAFPAYTQTSVDVRSLWPDGVPEEIEQAKDQAPKPSVATKEPSAARKRMDEIDKTFGTNKQVPNPDPKKSM